MCNNINANSCNIAGVDIPSKTYRPESVLTSGLLGMVEGIKGVWDSINMAVASDYIKLSAKELLYIKAMCNSQIDVVRKKISEVYDNKSEDFSETIYDVIKHIE